MNGNLGEVASPYAAPSASRPIGTDRVKPSDANLGHYGRVNAEGRGCNGKPAEVSGGPV